MLSSALTGEDLARVVAHGLTPSEAERQLELLRHPPVPARLARPARAGDGIRVLSEAQVERLRTVHREVAAAGRLQAFVPASGAATRMFRTLLAARESAAPLERDALAARAARGDGQALELLAFADGLPRFAFFDDLARAMAAHGLDLEHALRRGELRIAIDTLLDRDGLGYATRAKAAIPFHRYVDGSRTALEEHLVETAATARAASHVVGLHFTLSPQHRADLVVLLGQVRPRVERRVEARFAVGLSEQSPATDTLAIDAHGQPFRAADGSLLFRPGGHGALIGNLADLGADLVLVKNIDNVMPDHLRGPCVRWKQALAGLLAATQRKIFAALRGLEESPSPAAVDAAMAFLEGELDVPAPLAVARAPVAERLAWARRKLDRPLRVCGMVRATGDPGGGPFWVEGRDGVSLQIVETAQVDLNDRAQRAAFTAATHFNPVDLALGLRDRHGRPFDLRRHVDHEAAFVSEKSSGGRALRALEHPGLWNGGMADWTTLFVEVPLETFNPVKTVNDLLRPEHQPPVRV